MDNINKIKLLSKPWVNIKDIELIVGCGRDKASNIRDEIIKILECNGKKLPRGRNILIPTKNLIEYLCLDIEYFYNMACLESKLMKGV